MSGEVYEKGLIAGGLSACIYAGPGCTGDSAGFNDCAGCGTMTNIWSRKKSSFESAVSWQVVEGDC